MSALDFEEKSEKDEIALGNFLKRKFKSAKVALETISGWERKLKRIEHYVSLPHGVPVVTALCDKIKDALK